jgi:hypothetical protein
VRLSECVLRKQQRQCDSTFERAKREHEGTSVVLLLRVVTCCRLSCDEEANRLSLQLSHWISIGFKLILIESTCILSLSGFDRELARKRNAKELWGFLKFFGQHSRVLLPDSANQHSQGQARTIEAEAQLVSKKKRRRYGSRNLREAAEKKKKEVALVIA